MTDIVQIIDRFGLGVVMALAFLWSVHYMLTVTLPRMIVEQTVQLKSQQDVFVSTLNNLEKRWDAREERRDRENERICAQMSVLAEQVSDLIRAISDGHESVKTHIWKDPSKTTSKEPK